MNSSTVALIYNHALKEELLDDALPRGNMHAEKRRNAIKWLGRRYVLHKVNRVQKVEIVEKQAKR